jgi:hypothetical protein
MNTPRFNSVDEALASLPRALQPARDLWPDIARQLGERSDGIVEFKPRAPAGRFASRWPLAMAASLAVAGLVGALCWSVLQQRLAPELVARSAPPAATARTLVNFEPMHNADYVTARASLERVFNERLKLLAPATQARIQADLETIRKANDDIRAALAKDPASPLLLKLLQSTGQQEIDLYTSVAQTTEPMLLRRTRT